MAIIDPTEFSFGVKLDDYFFGGRGWQAWLILPFIRIGYTSKAQIYPGEA